MTIYVPSEIPSDQKIETSRLSSCDSRQLFAAVRDPTVLARWWGPDGFTNTFDSFEFREGGSWQFTMHSPDGKDYYNESQFRRIVEPSLIVVDHQCAPLFQLHLTFDDTPEGCRIGWCMIFADSKLCSNVAKYAGDANEQNINRLLAAVSEVD